MEWPNSQSQCQALVYTGLTQGISVLRAESFLNGVPWFKASALGSSKEPFYWWNASYYPSPFGTQSMATTDQLPWQRISSIHPVTWFDFVMVMKMAGAGASITFSAIPTFLLYMLIIFHCYDYQKSISTFSVNSYWILSKAVCQGGKGI